MLWTEKRLSCQAPFATLLRERNDILKAGWNGERMKEIYTSCLYSLGWTHIPDCFKCLKELMELCSLVPNYVILEHLLEKLCPLRKICLFNLTCLNLAKYLTLFGINKQSRTELEAWDLIKFGAWKMDLLFVFNENVEIVMFKFN